MSNKIYTSNDIVPGFSFLFNNGKHFYFGTIIKTEGEYYIPFYSDLPSQRFEKLRKSQLVGWLNDASRYIFEVK